MSARGLVPAPHGGEGQPRRGAALVAALAALAVITVLVLGALFSAARDVRDGSSAIAQQRARDAAEGSVAAAVAHWDARRNVRLAEGDVDVLPAVGSGGTVRIVRVGALAFQVESEARSPAGPALDARRHVSLAVRLLPAEPTVLAAFTTAGTLHVGALASVSGLDSAPPAWSDCPPSSAAVPAVAAADLGTVTVDAGGVLTGTGPVLAAAAAAEPPTYATFGDESWTSLARDADVRASGLVPHSPSPRASAGDCVLDRGSWGEPARGIGSVRQCEDAFPVVHVAHARPLLVRGPARGQGILLVDGDLEVDGDFEFDGLVVVRDDVRVVSGALRVRGIVLAANEDPTDGSSLGGRSRVTFSSCALQRALLGAARVAPVERRARATLSR